MPAHRSEAEAEVRLAVVERLRVIRPAARIIHEIKATDLGNRIDVLAVSDAEIIAVEIKSKKDTLKRLPKQIEAMKGCAHHVIAALHEKFLRPTKTWQGNHHFEKDGEFFTHVPPDEAVGSEPWIYPEIERGGKFDHLARWSEPKLAPQQALPENALDILWRGELLALCHHLGLSLPRRPTMDVMKTALRWNCSGGEITKGICIALRARDCIEADPALQWEPRVDRG